MPDPMASVNRGDPLRIGAETWNGILAGIRKVNGRHDQRATGGGWGTVEALALNSTGADLREYKPATVTAAGGYGLDDDFAAQDWNRRPSLTLGVPSAATDWVVVTLEAIPAGSIGRVAVSGVCLCDIASASGSTKWAKATASSTASLTASDTDGTVRVLHVPSTGTPKRCAVYLHDKPAGAAIDYAHNGGGLSSYTVTGSYTSVYTQSLAAGTWAVWYSLTGSMYGAVGIYLQARVTDGTTPAALTRFGMTQVANVYTTETASGCHVYTLASAGSISLQVSHTGAPTFASLSAGSLLSMRLA